MYFQKIVVIVAVVVLIIILVGVGVSLGNGYNAKWPPTTANCPDYWEDTSGNGKACVNSKKLGTCNIPTESDTNSMDFDQPPFNQNNSKCSQYKWASNCGVVWDGITSGIPNPCDSKEPV